MKRNKIMWVLVLFFVSITIVVTYDVPQSLSEGLSSVLPSPTPVTLDSILGKYGTVDYENSAPVAPSELERRKRINRRYDNQGWVQINPHPATGKIGRVKEESLPEVLPTKESDLIVTGKVLGVTTYLSNDKEGIYSEFSITVDQIIAKSSGIDVRREGVITVDRAGGVVRYPNSQTVLYLDSVKGLPEVGREYALFLKADRSSGNFEVVTGFELHDVATVPLDVGRPMDDIARLSKSNFIKAVREKIAQPNGNDRTERKP